MNMRTGLIALAFFCFAAITCLSYAQETAKPEAAGPSVTEGSREQVLDGTLAQLKKEHAEVVRLRAEVENLKHLAPLPMPPVQQVLLPINRLEYKVINVQRAGTAPLITEEFNKLADEGFDYVGPLTHDGVFIVFKRWKALPQLQMRPAAQLPRTPYNPRE
jgi:hypothetical protein